MPDDKNESRDWHLRLIATWIGQDLWKTEEIYHHLIAAAYEWCACDKRHSPDLAFHLDVPEFLNTASRRLAGRLFGNREIGGGAPGAIPVPFPFIDENVWL